MRKSVSFDNSLITIKKILLSGGSYGILIIQACFERNYL
ncbi:hypothetical protein TPHV1_200035 [Treponema phagedenis]|uniref:Uncharacterized protein n=1 Tax=Treponema phagedenis TaxID=162 RepID=A0A0B7GXR0_TREPH|nr:hypothetical protein TPHV1_200035 [Treponema phagedenis]